MLALSKRPSPRATELGTGMQLLWLEFYLPQIYLFCCCRRRRRHVAMLLPVGKSNRFLD